MSEQAQLERIFVEPTVRCNLRCLLCYRGRDDVPKRRDMTLEKFERLLASLPEKCSMLDLYGFGETLLHRDAPEMIRAAANKGLLVALASNFNVPERAVTQAVHSGLHEMLVGLDGVTQSSYATYRRGGRLERVLRNVEVFQEEREKLGSSRPRLVLQFLVMRHNEGEVERFRTLGRELGVDEARIKTVTLRSYTQERSLLPEDPALRRYDAGGRPTSDPRRCPWPLTGCAVLCDGSIQPCCNAGHEPASCMGNVFTDGLMQTWRSPRYEAFRRRMRESGDGIPACGICSSAAMPDIRAQLERLNAQTGQ